MQESRGKANLLTAKEGRLTIIALIVAAAVAVALSAASAGWAQQAGADSNRVDKTSKKSFSDTVSAVEKAAKAEGMMIVAKLDHKNMLAMVGAKINGSTTIEFGKPDMSKMLLPMNAAIGLEVPAKIYVFEVKDGKVVVSYRKVAPQFSTYGHPDIAKAGAMMDMILDNITTAATQ